MGTTGTKIRISERYKSGNKASYCQQRHRCSGRDYVQGIRLKKISSIQDVSSLPTQGAKTVTPTTTEQIAVASGLYTTGDIKVAGDANLVPDKHCTGVSIFGVTGTHSGGGGGGGIFTVTNNSSFKIYGVTESENGPCPCDIDKFDSGRVKANSVVIYLNNVSAARITWRLPRRWICRVYRQLLPSLFNFRRCHF